MPAITYDVPAEKLSHSSVAACEQDIEHTLSDPLKRYTVEVHEGSHSYFYRLAGIEVEFLGPRIIYDESKNKMFAAYGGVNPRDEDHSLSVETLARILVAGGIAEKVICNTEDYREHCISDYDGFIALKRLEVKPSVLTYIWKKAQEDLEQRLVNDSNLRAYILMEAARYGEEMFPLLK